MTKIYIKENKIKNQDGELLTTIETHFSKPDKYDYIVFLDK
jgi:hypothetical protein